MERHIHPASDTQYNHSNVYPHLPPSPYFPFLPTQSPYQVPTRTVGHSIDKHPSFIFLSLPCINRFSSYFPSTKLDQKERIEFE